VIALTAVFIIKNKMDVGKYYTALKGAQKNSVKISCWSAI